MLIKPRKIKDKDYINISSLFLILLLFLLGFIGPGFWKINSPNFKFFVFQRDVNKVTTIVNKEEKFNFNNKYLSLDQINKKSKVIKWSNQVISSIEKQLPLPRMYFSSIPKNIDEYQIFEKKKSLFEYLITHSFEGKRTSFGRKKAIKNCLPNE